MRGVIEGWRRLVARLREREIEHGLDEEIRFHVDKQTEKYRKAGLAPDEARRQALVRFGGVERTREATRDELRFTALEDLVRDLRHAVRALCRAPGFAFVATLTLALGIGATSAMFSVLDGVVLRPLPYPAQERLVELVHEAPGLGASRLYASPAIYFSYRDHGRVFEAVGLWDWDRSPVTVTGLGDPEAVTSVELTHEVLDMLGAEPVLGRAFGPADDRPGSAPTAMISHGYWRRRFVGQEPVGRTLVVDGVAREIIGVLPASFRFFDYAADVFYPLQPVRASAEFPSFDGRGIARVKPGVTLAQADADAARMIPILAAEFGRGGGGSWEKAGFGPRLEWLKDAVVGRLRDTLWILMGTIGLLLLLACANVANLVLVRTETRRPQLAIRAALGAGRTAIARVVVTEGIVLGLVGGAAGLAVAYLSLPGLVSLAGSDLPQVMTVAVDTRVLLFALGASLVATVLFALVPVIQLTARTSRLTRELHAAGRWGGFGPRGRRTRHALVVGQVALALVLLVGSGLMIRTFHELRQVDPGFRDPEAVQTFQLTIPLPEERDDEAAAESRERQLRTKQEIVERLTAVTGVESASFSAFNDGLPLDGDGRGRFVYIEGRPAPVRGETPPKEVQYVAPGFFETMRTSVVAGRSFDWSDVYQQHPVALVSENLARAEWATPVAALGQRIATSSNGPWCEVVGVVKDVRHWGLSQPAPQVVVFPAVASTVASFVLRSGRVGAAGFLDEIRKAVWSVNGSLSLAGVQTLGDLYRRSLARSSMTMKLLAITGGLALVLGLVGIYGVVGYAVAQRRREIGIRLALGARQGEVRRMFVSLALGLVAAGVALGLAAAAGLTRLLSSQLYGISPLDPLTHAGVALALLAAAALASYLSARRASALDPVEVLRGE